MPPGISAFAKFDETLRQEMPEFQEVAILLQKLDDVGLTVQVDDELVTLSFTYNFDRESFRGKQYLPLLQKQYERISELSSQLEQAHDALMAAFTEQAG